MRPANSQDLFPRYRAVFSDGFAIESWLAKILIGKKKRGYE